MNMLIFEPNKATRKLFVDYVKELQPTLDIVECTSEKEAFSLLKEEIYNYVLVQHSLGVENEVLIEKPLMTDFVKLVFSK